VKIENVDSDNQAKNFYLGPKRRGFMGVEIKFKSSTLPTLCARSPVEEESPSSLTLCRIKGGCMGSLSGDFGR